MTDTKLRALGAGLGVLLAGGVFGAGPAMAVSQSTCVYNESNKNVIVTDNSGGATLRLFTTSVGGVIGVADDPDTDVLCMNPSGTKFARVTNAERIAIFAAPQHVPGGYRIDQNNGRFAPGVTPETDGDSEVEITLNTTGVPAELTVVGTPQRDVISVGTRGRVNFSYDTDADIEPLTKASHVRVSGGVGNDEIDGLGGSIFSPPTDVEVRLEGDAGNDVLFTGPNAQIPVVIGGSGDDRIFTANGTHDGISGGLGNDVATLDRGDSTPFNDVETMLIGSPVGKLRLPSKVIEATAGKPAPLELSWTHPKAWKQLRTVELRLSQGADVIGTITARPEDGSVRGRGVAKVAASKLSHHGKTVTAELAVRLDRSLAGQDVRVDVLATDRKGHTQMEPQAGVIRIAK
jgi:hypothetical protein